ncbi:MAG: helix-turn-helix transcriptional regulator [Candidatus Pedobacter colombiensis]|uniref:Helix-turn-helix transcriptional regulator n=1 Tax=Candidatus Pedobacter colombiensis TaxID=3121371 RepID=A0AAJ5W4Y5_9SPHI|nr:helix-turn-helix transcriptional regulator [Pedobacter sp.]WEK18608.1 MAG: helix-turn-helix transcriptional regulator [Pedobacter sp.]
MQSHIKLHLAAGRSVALTPDALPQHSAVPIRMAKAEKIKINEGDILIQSLSHYLAYIELFEYTLTQEVNIDFSVIKPSFFMYINLRQNSCYLCYRSEGKYRETLTAGAHQMMLITFSPEWLIYKSEKLAELKSFTAFFNNPKRRSVNLPSFGIAKSLFNLLKKTDLKVNHLNMDASTYIFINNCITKYYNKLISRNCNNEYLQHKATAIAQFIHENFTSEKASSVHELADRFMVSERSLARLAKMAFGIPLHEQVIKLRIDLALRLLLTTNKPIYEIARLSGYKEPHYFSKAFKKYYEISPKGFERPCKEMVTLEMQG